MESCVCVSDIQNVQPYLLLSLDIQQQQHSYNTVVTVTIIFDITHYFPNLMGYGGLKW